MNALIELLMRVLPEQVMVPVWALLSFPLMAVGILGSYLVERRHR